MISWDEHFANVIKAIEEGKNVLIQGAGGVGKTHIINRLQMIMDEKDEPKFPMVLTATTGVASVLIGGVTIHSAIGINCAPLKIDELTKEKTVALVIDEISMFSGAQFDLMMKKIDKINAKRLKNDFKPISIIISGDPMQLPPIKSESGFFFNGTRFEDFLSNGTYVANLYENKRTSNKEYADILASVRLGNTTPEVMSLYSSIHQK